jgi:hypothetical protein
MGKKNRVESGPSVDWEKALGKPFAVQLVDEKQKPVQRCDFIGGKASKEDVGGDQFYLTCEIEFANGAKAYGVVAIEDSEARAGLHVDTGIFHPGTGQICWQSGKNFLRRLGMRREDVFPYRYRYYASLEHHDSFIGPDGWSIWDAMMKELAEEAAAHRAGVTKLFLLSEGCKTWEDEDRENFASMT